MKSYEATAAIGAGPERIWAILVDGPGYPSWDSGVEGVEGVVAPGETIRVRSAASPKRAFPVKVTAFEPAP